MRSKPPKPRRLPYKSFNVAVETARRAQSMFRWRTAADLWFTAAGIGIDDDGEPDEVWVYCRNQGINCLKQAEAQEGAHEQLSSNGQLSGAGRSR